MAERKLGLEFKTQMKEKVEQIESVIATFLPKEVGLQRTIFRAMNYSVNAGGKRLRPMLMQEVYQLFCDDDSRASQILYPFMAAIEMIHTYSLVHDDLPAMDNDDYRRGRKTTHKVYGEAMGILAGDALLNYAFETATNAFVCADCLEQSAKAMRILATKAGCFGMLGGQVIDVEAEGRDDITLEDICVIHELKTAALIESAMTIGAVLANADEKQVAVVEKIARNIGLAFQIQDDILDVTGSFEELGKPIGSDEDNDKITYVSLQGVEKSAEEVARLSKEALDLIETLPGEKQYLKDLVEYLITRRK